MFFKKRQKIKGQAVFEYMMLIIFVLTAFMLFQKYIFRAFSGRWKAVGDSMSAGQSYDPNNTVECETFGAYHATEDARFPDTEMWYTSQCFDDNCFQPCLRAPIDAVDCKACIIDCAGQAPECN